MTRSEANQLIKSRLDADQLEEFNYQIGLRQETIDDEITAYGETEETPSDYVDVLIDLTDRTEDTICRSTDSAWKKQARALLKIYNRLLLEIGFYRPATPDEIETSYTFTSSRGMRKTVFLKIDGVKVTSDKSFSCFLTAFK